MIEGVTSRLKALRDMLDVRLLSADTFGTLDSVALVLGIETQVATDALDKLRVVEAFGPENCVAVDNGADDALMCPARDPRHSGRRPRGCELGHHPCGRCCLPLDRRCTRPPPRTSSDRDHVENAKANVSYPVEAGAGRIRSDCVDAMKLA